MTDIDLLTLGGVVSFIVVAGVYVYARERFTAMGDHAEELEREFETPAERSRPRRVA